MRQHPITEDLVEDIADIAREAGARILAVYETDFDVESKGDSSPLTAADLAANRVIVAGLEGHPSKLPILSEESSKIPFAERGDWHRYWLVDPLDGTREFVKRNGEFTVNIALIEEHRPILGVVYVPVSGVCYGAAIGHGAFRRNRGGAPEPIRVRAFPAGRITVVGSRSHGNDATRAFIRELGDVKMVAIGSSLKICLVAEGHADVYPRFGPTSEWDTAAAQCVVEQAGGQLTDTSLRALRYNTKPSLLNPHFLVFGDKSHDWAQYIPRDGAA